MVWPWCAFRMQVWNVLHAARWKCRTQKSPKICHLGIIAQLRRSVSLQLRHVSAVGKKLLNSHVCLTCPHNMVNFGSLAAEICWLVWGTPAHFSGFRILAAARHSSSGRQSNFAALNRGRHLYLAGQPSRLELAHILVANVSPVKLWTIVLWVFICKCWKCCLLCQLIHEVDQHCIYVGWSDVTVICGYIMISMLRGNMVYCTKSWRFVRILN